MLLGPVARKLPGKRLLVVSDGALQYLPFAALPVPGGQTPPVPLAAEQEVVSLPPASVLGVLRRQTRGRTPPRKADAILADPVFEHDDPRLDAANASGGTRSSETGVREFPRLAATRQEAAAIASTAPDGGALRALGFRASRRTALSPELAQYGIVHFATHGVFDDESPGRSGIVLSMFDERGRAQE